MKLSLDLGRWEDVTFGNIGVWFLPDTMTSCIQTGTKTIVAQSLPFHHLSVCSGGGAPRGETGKDTIIRFVLRTLGMLLTKPVLHKYLSCLKNCSKECLHMWEMDIVQAEDSGCQLTRLRSSRQLVLHSPIHYNGVGGGGRW